jgi:hypothetical protein
MDPCDKHRDDEGGLVFCFYEMLGHNWTYVARAHKGLNDSHRAVQAQSKADSLLAA